MTDALNERERICRHLRGIAAKVLNNAIEHDQYDLERADLIATVLEETADAVEAGLHWSEE